MVRYGWCRYPYYPRREVLEDVRLALGLQRIGGKWLGRRTGGLP